MIYLVTGQLNLFENDAYKNITVEESLAMMKDWNVVQYDSETDGRDAHINKLLCVQFGNDAADTQIVVDTSTINILLYKDILESKTLIGQNLKFDLAFLYNYNIIPRQIYDTMIVEQLLHLGYPSGVLSYSLKAIADRRLGIDIDKTVRGEIIWRGLDTSVIKYAAGDVMYLEQIARSQLLDLHKQDLIKAAKIECDFVPVITYLEWCGIYLNELKWKEKMDNDSKALSVAHTLLDKYVTSDSRFKKFTYVNLQGDLFLGYNTEPQCLINWDSPSQVTKFCKFLGFDTTIQDKETGEDKDSILEKVLKGQKGIADDFLAIYFDYREHAKVCSTYGQGHLNAINPKTGRIHTIYKQLGAASGRMSCGSRQQNTDLAKLKGISPKNCTYPNMQQLPADDATRGSFTNQYPDTLICSADYSALESRLGGDIYNEKAIIEEFLHGSGDMHSLVAKACFPKELEGIEVKDIKKLRPDLRKKAKGPEFAMQFGGSPMAIQQSLACTIEEAEAIADAYWEGFPGVAKFKAEGSKFVRKNGYVLMCKYSGHKMYWWDHDVWLSRQNSFTSEFWNEYRDKHKGTNDDVAQMVRKHFQAASKWDRMALNAPTQGSGICILKISMKKFFDWIIENNYFNKVKLCALVHDEAVIEFPKNISNAPKVLKECMEEGASIVCKSMPIPSVPEVGTHWIH